MGQAGDVTITTKKVCSVKILLFWYCPGNGIPALSVVVSCCKSKKQEKTKERKKQKQKQTKQNKEKRSDDSPQSYKFKLNTRIVT